MSKRRFIAVMTALLLGAGALMGDDCDIDFDDGRLKIDYDDKPVVENAMMAVPVALLWSA